MSFWHILLGVLFLVICFLLIIIILLQKGKGGGLGAAFGGAGSSAFGTRTGDVFTWVTIVLTGLFLLLAIATNLSFRPSPGVVARPTFSPLPQAIPDHEHLTVKLDCNTKGSTIHYTTDGTDPDENSAPYIKPLTVEPGAIIKAMGFRDNWKPSAVAEGKYPQAAPTTAAAHSMVMPTSKPAAPSSAPAKPEPATPVVPATN